MAGIKSTGVLQQDTVAGGVFRKKVRSWNEIRMLQALQELHFPAPRLLGVEQAAEGGVCLLMEQVGVEHLETHPAAFPQALDLALQIRQLDLPADVQPITTASHLQNLQQGPDLRDVCARLRFSSADTAMVLQLYEQVRQSGTYGEPLVFAHGDLHPRNLMIRLQESGREITVIDWEKAGRHSIFQDLYALLHMCYPEAEASLVYAEQERLFELYAPRLGIADRRDGYRTFLFLNRFYELVQISKDISHRLRDEQSLLRQAQFVLQDLHRRIRATGGFA